MSHKNNKDKQFKTILIGLGTLRTHSCVRQTKKEMNKTINAYFQIYQNGEWWMIWYCNTLYKQSTNIIKIKLVPVKPICHSYSWICAIRIRIQWDSQKSNLFKAISNKRCESIKLEIFENFVRFQNSGTFISVIIAEHNCIFHSQHISNSQSLSKTFRLL